MHTPVLPIATQPCEDVEAPSDSDLGTIVYDDLEEGYLVMTSPSQAYDEIDFEYLTPRAPDPISRIPGASLIGQHWLSQPNARSARGPRWDVQFGVPGDGRVISEEDMVPQLHSGHH